jgi:hypothetical protein
LKGETPAANSTVTIFVGVSRRAIHPLMLLRHHINVKPVSTVDAKETGETDASPGGADI